MANSKLKLLYLIDILKSKTDEEHIINATEICKYLADKGITAERKSIYRDIEALIDYGYDIVCVRGKNSGYFLGTRVFEEPELLLLVDAIQASGTITAHKTRELLSKLEGFVSENVAKKFVSRTYVNNRSKCENERLYYIISDLFVAIHKQLKVNVSYSRYYLENKTIKTQEKLINISPYALMWDNDKYYLIGNNSKYENLIHLRVDRIAKVEITTEPNKHFSLVSEYKQQFDTADYSKKTFNMYGGQLERIDLECKKNLLGSIIDRFGSEIFIRSDDEQDTFRFATDALVGEGLVGWIMQFGGEIKVLSPETLKQQVKNKILQLNKVYEI